MKRREFIALIGGGAAAWPLAARAQQSERMRRIGILLPVAADDAEFQTRVGAFLQGLQQLGWAIGRNVRIDTRWAGASATEIRRHAAELVELAPDVILAHGVPTLGPLLQATRTVPIVFPTATDPVAAGFVDSLARPGGNATGFMDLEYGMAGKWLELGPSGSRHTDRPCPVRCNPGRGAVARDGGKPGQCARRQRDRARRRGRRALSKWRFDRDAERVGERSSRADRQACRATHAARRLLRTLLRR